MLAFNAADVGTKEAATADRAARARELRVAGWLIEDIAREIGVCSYTAHVYCAGVPRGSQQAHPGTIATRIDPEPTPTLDGRSGLPGVDLSPQ